MATLQFRNCFQIDIHIGNNFTIIPVLVTLVCLIKKSGA